MKSIKIQITDLTDNTTEIKEFCVNDSNHGLFVWENHSCNYKQLKGTCDFKSFSAKELSRKLHNEYFECSSYQKVRMVRNSAQGW